MIHLLSLFAALRSRKLKAAPTTIYEDNISGGISILPDDASSTQHPLVLTTNPTYQLSDQSTTAKSTQQSSQASPTQSSTNSFYTALDDSHQSYSTGQQFALEFGGMASLNNLSELEEARATLLLPPLLEFEYFKTDCSQLTRHMWAHTKDQDFATKAELYSCVRNNWEIEIVHKSSIISNMKTAGTKKMISLYARENWFI